MGDCVGSFICLTESRGHVTGEKATGRCEESSDSRRGGRCASKAVAVVAMPWGCIAVCERHQEWHEGGDRG